MVIKRNALLFVCFLLHFFGVSQDPILTDRPDQTEGVFIIPKGYFQLESGIHVEANKQNTTTYLIPTNLLKFGLHKRVELQSVLELNYSKSGGLGLLPVSLGFKANLLKQNGIIPQFALIGRYKFKGIATVNYKDVRNSPLIILAFENIFQEKFALGYNLGLSWNGVTSNPNYIASLSLGYTLDEQSTFFLELFNENEAGFNYQLVDLGYIFTINNKVIIDFCGGKFLGKTDQNYFFTLGLTTRFNALKFRN
jgi:hypothetical protein